MRSKFFLSVSVLLFISFNVFTQNQRQNPNYNPNSGAYPQNNANPNSGNFQNNNPATPQNSQSPQQSPAPKGQQPVKKREPQAGFSVIALYSESPHYPGSNEFKKTLLALPGFFYRSEHIDFTFPRLTFLKKNSKVTLSLSFSPSFGLNSADLDESPPKDYNKEGAEIDREKNYRRRGMEDIPAMLVTNFTINYKISFLYFQLSYIHENEFGGNYPSYGAKAVPEVGVRLGYPFQLSDSKLLILGGISYSREFGDDSHNSFYFGVDSKDEIPNERPVYRAKGGWIQQITTFSLGWKYKRWFFNAKFTSSDLSSSDIKDSPLVINKKNSQQNYTLAYTFYQF